MNFEVVEAVVKYGRQIQKESEKRFYFTITTNGNINQPNEISCILQKKRIECALRINAWQAEYEQK